MSIHLSRDKKQWEMRQARKNKEGVMMGLEEGDGMMKAVVRKMKTLTVLF